MRKPPAVAGFAAAMPGSTYSASQASVNNFSESMAYAVRRWQALSRDVRGRIGRAEH